MTYTLTEIATLTGAQRYGNADMPEIDRLLTDSRSLAFPETSLFFALRTAQGDGHRYIDELYQRGMRSFVVETLPTERAVQYADANFLVVDSSLRALQCLAQCRREPFSVPVVGITGSNGKTIVKEWLYQLLSSCKRVTRSPRSYNSQLGVPLSVWFLNEQTEVALFEAGISQPGEMAALQRMIQPTLGVMTNIGSAHGENFVSRDEKLKEKVKLFRDCDVVVCNGDDAAITSCLERALGRERLVFWSKTNKEAALFVRSVTVGETKTHIIYNYLGHEGTFDIPFTDDASLENALHCLTICLLLHTPADRLAEGLARLEPVAMRLEVKRGRGGCTLINDSYNSDVNSLGIALDFLVRRSETQTQRRTIILSDLLQTGLPADELYQKVAAMVNARAINRLIGVGKELPQYAGYFAMEKMFFPTTDALLRSDILETLHEETILIKGARAFAFDHVSELLALRVHETTLEINLTALADNLSYYRRLLQPDTRMICMVKAAAYGAGAVEVAQTLQDRRADYLAVAVADEGADLRRAGITANILVMNPELTAFKEMFDYDLQCEVYNFHLLEALICAAEKEGITGYPVHIKLDTGMNRLGFSPKEEEIDKLINRLKAQTAVVPRSVFSHFAGSDSPAFDAFSDEQFARFDGASRRLQAAFKHKILRHICNSAGMERFPERQLDMVRLGLGLYGVNPTTNQPLHTVTTLKTTILQIREVAKGETVGYSRRTAVARNSRIAALPIGYADGLNRRLGNGKAYCLVNGQKAPYAGNICMDICMIDVTDIDCREGDTAILFGEDLPVSYLSDVLETIPYEVLTGISGRVKRVYYQE